MKYKSVKVWSALAAVLMMTAFVSCNKDQDKQETMEKPTVDALQWESKPDFDAYFQKTTVLLQQFWLACDEAYYRDSVAFMRACQTESLSDLMGLIRIDEQQFRHFREVAMSELEQIEADYPGIRKTFYESPCQDCTEHALSHLGEVVAQSHGSLSKGDGSNLSMCVFVCSMACMTTMELYLPCLASCVSICHKYF
ncbi:MAG: hypothetical protein IKU03_02080 [Bacteroidales bacterium]|nr:hypothetical protein [Bacteroidales bacterium]